MYLDLETVKKHLLVDSTFTDDDSYITELIQVAENAVEVNLGIALKELEDGEGNLPHSITHAMLLMAGNLYANREPVVLGVTSVELPFSYRYLVGLYKKWTVK